MRQRDRVLLAMARAGSDGIMSADFAAVPADGGPPIPRLASCIKELREFGYSIDSHQRRDGQAIYVLSSELPGHPHVQLTLFDPGATGASGTASRREGEEVAES